MFQNYFKIAWRNLLKSKGYSAINIGGLAAGMAVALFIGLWVYDEVSYNKYHENYAKIAQVMQHANFNGNIETQTSNPGVMGQEIRSKYGSDFKHVVQASWMGGHLFTIGTKNLGQSGIFMEPDAPDMLSLKMIKGTRQGLKDPNSVLLSRSAAKALYGDEDPMNKIIRLDRQSDVKVTGVFEDLPDNTTFKGIKVLMPWELWLIQNPWAKKRENPWGSNFSQTFVQVADNADMQKVSAKIKSVKIDQVGPEEKKYKWEVFLHPMSKWNLYGDFKNGINSGGNIRYVWLFSAIGLFVLILACINFMNLSTARSEKRAREVGIRKAIGSLRWQIIRQFFAESYVVVILAFVLATILASVLLPSFNEVAGKNISFPWESGIFWACCLLFIFLTGLLAGSYPAFYLSSFQPLKVLKGTFKAGKNAAIPRRVLVVLQFTISVMLITGTVIVYQQIQYAKNRPIGYQRNNLINLSFEPEIRQHFDALRNELKSSGAIEEMTAANSPLTGVWNTNGGFEWEGKDPNLAVDFPHNFVTYEFGKTVNWKIKAGRDFSRDFATDTMAFVINESAAKFLGFQDPVGKTLKWEGQPFQIIGVVNDIMQESPFYPIRPSVYHVDRYENMFNVIVKLNPGKSSSASISVIEKTWKKYAPEALFSYKFVDEAYGSKFMAEERIGTLSSWFAVLAILISCLGLFGMASFVAEQRTKEIGIRKVLGASVANLWKLLSIEFFVLVLVSCLIAAPISYYYLHSWLQNYDYRIGINWLVFLFASMIALLITLLTVSFQAIKAAQSNPIKTLRSE